MPHPQPPQRPDSADIPGSLGHDQSPKDVLCAPLPLHAQSPLLCPSHRLSVGVPPMSTAFQEPAEFQAPPSVFSFDKPHLMQWAAPRNFSVDRMGLETASYGFSVPSIPDSGDFRHYTQNGMSYSENQSHPYPEQYSGGHCPRSYHGLDLNDFSGSCSMSQAYPPAAYQIEPPKQHDAMDLSDNEINGQLIQMSNEYDHHQCGPRIKVENLNRYQSPYSDHTRASTPQDDPPKNPKVVCGGEDIAIDKDQPYAQLIYQALMHAPGHTMILREIYHWFKTNTDKALGSETKGWQNSIRHNLSMNGAFEKVDCPGEEARKGFMWRLTAEAIREGVKSTTRYRSKQPNKRIHRAQYLPHPQRQASGAKGGHAARRSVRSKRIGQSQDAYHSQQFTSRSVPAAFDTMFGNDASAGLSEQYPQSPYYGSESDFQYGSQKDNVGSPLLGIGPAPADLFPQMQSYTGGPMYQSDYLQHANAMVQQGSSYHGLPIRDTAHIVDHSPAASLFTNSPTPSADEPLTPGYDAGWNDDVALGNLCIFDDQMAYREYAG